MKPIYVKSTCYLLIAFALASCTITRQQIIETRWSGIKSESPEFVVADSQVVLRFNLWNERGLLKATIENQSDTTLIIDLRRSYFVANEVAHPYFADASPGMAFMEIPSHSQRDLSKFYVDDVHPVSFDARNFETKGAASYTDVSSNVKCRHILSYKLGGTTWSTSEQSFYVSAKQPWVHGQSFIRKNPESNSPSKKDDYYIESTKPTPVGYVAGIALIVVYALGSEEEPR